MRVGVTGGIGSGKSSVCRMFSTLGIPVFDADLEARKIIDGDQDVLKELSEIAGLDLLASGVLDRRLLASLIFNDPVKLEKVNTLIHPLVFDAFESWCLHCRAPYVILDAAILFESGADRLVDRTITVIAPRNERIERVVARSGLSPAEVEARVRNQYTQEQLMSRSDFIIDNSERKMIIPAVLDIHTRLLAESANISR
ncbi:MAG: dephospho-CoA kinase [Bacteroidales bacterium]|jgi:dephospho-CoA kinase|nr:dephospho-CoA kinase [Bacteroidales bacterium]